MTDGKENANETPKIQLTGSSLPDEYLKREVLHYAPDAKGNITKYILPEHEARRAIAKTARIPARIQKRKESTPDPTTVGMEGGSAGDSKISPPSPKRRKKSKTTRTRTSAKVKPPRVTPGGHNQVNQAILPENEVKGPQDDDVVLETPPRNSPESSRSPSPVKLEAMNLTTFPSGIRSGFQRGHGPQLAEDPENDVFMEQAVPESCTPMVVPPIRLIHPTPHSTPIKVQPMSKTVNDGSTHLTVNEGPTSRAPSEAPSSTSSISGEPPTFDTLFRCARNSVWRAASKMLPAVRLKALMEEDIERLVKIDIVALHVIKKEPPPEVLDIAQHWRIIGTVGNELRDKGADVGKVARKVAQLLDELEIGDEDDAIAMWIQMLPS
jgi:hypothetical protein